MNPFAEVDWNPNEAKKRKFATSLMIGFPALAAFWSLIILLGQRAWHPSLVYVALAGAALGAILWLLPAIARPFYVIWYFIACCLGFVIGNILLLGFYYLVMTPMGLLLRGYGKLSLQKGFDRKALTYWRDAKKPVDLQSYYRQF